LDLLKSRLLDESERHELIYFVILQLKKLTINKIKLCFWLFSKDLTLIYRVFCAKKEDTDEGLSVS